MDEVQIMVPVPLVDVTDSRMGTVKSIWVAIFLVVIAREDITGVE